MKERFQKTIKYVRRNLTRFLFLGVVLTACFSIKFAAYGKYVNYLNEYTTVSAAPFYFSSNYLGEPGTNEYTIGSFDKKRYELDVEIRNYDNAYNYNPAGVDFYYYVTAELFAKDGVTPLTDKTDYATTIYYGSNNEKAAAMVNVVKTSDDDADVADGVKNVIIDGSNDEKNDVVKHSDQSYSFKYKTVGYIEGLSPASDSNISSLSSESNVYADISNNGKQTVKITVVWTEPVEEDVILKVSAYTIPPTTSSNSSYSGFIGSDSYDLTIRKLNTELAARGQASASNIPTDYASKVGVYEKKLDATFHLVVSGGEGAIITPVYHQDETDYTLSYKLKSNYNTTATVYFNANKMDVDDSISASDAGNGYKKFDVSLYGNGTTTSYFYRRTLDTLITYDAGIDMGDDYTAKEALDIYFIPAGADEATPGNATPVNS